MIINIITIGNTSVGKSCLCKRYKNGEFPNEITPTIGADFISKVVNINSESINVKFWDTAG